MSARVVILAGGPDPEHDVSVQSATAIAKALRASSEFEILYHQFDEITLDELRALGADVVWPALHGRWGEGGPAQDLLEELGVPYVGARPAGARAAIDKVLTKTIVSSLGFEASPSAVFNPHDDNPPIAFPFVLKPIYEGSTIGLYVCRSEADWTRARNATRASGRPAMIEPFIKGREVTCGLVDTGAGLSALPLIEITPAEGLYDYEAKYQREDTRYLVDPALPAQITDLAREMTLALAKRMGIRHLCRADFLLDDASNLHFLEINTMPGFTTHSLVPLAAAHAGLDMPALCAGIVRAAMAPTPA